MATGACVLSRCHRPKGEVALVNARGFELREGLTKPTSKFHFPLFLFNSSLTTQRASLLRLGWFSLFVLRATACYCAFFAFSPSLDVWYVFSARISKKTNMSDNLSQTDSISGTVIQNNNMSDTFSQNIIGS
jgi:hypothetical protein